MSVLTVGIDVSQDKLDVAIINKSQDKPTDLGTFSNENKGHKKLLKQLKNIIKKHELEKIRVVIEPSGGYEQPIARFALDHEWTVNMVNPFKVRKWAESEGIRAKTDRMDARLLANFAIAKGTLPQWQPQEEHIAQLDEMLKRKEELQQSLLREKNRLNALLLKLKFEGSALASIKRSIEWIQDEIRRLENDINNHIGKHTDLKEQVKKLKKTPGVGDKNSLYFLVLFHRWTSLTQGLGSAKQLTSYVGLDPVPRSSGSSIKCHEAISRKGNPSLRKMLYLGALGAVYGTTKGPLRTFFNRLVSRGKHKKLALIACARKILIWAWTTFHKNTSFDPLKFTS
ncbi:IS110 family transposase [Candidatus Uabimicrobium sp. HlEnr_7]|uniref:IS110 family transposase n=1 Tax=Candidatus Uabimicrobium helgolandensis TaxID=3095367 RepID=UPI00355644A7